MPKDLPQICPVCHMNKPQIGLKYCHNCIDSKHLKDAIIFPVNIILYTICKKCGQYGNMSWGIDKAKDIKKYIEWIDKVQKKSTCVKCIDKSVSHLKVVKKDENESD